MPADICAVAGSAISDTTNKEAWSKAPAGASAYGKPLGEKLKSCEVVLVRCVGPLRAAMAHATNRDGAAARTGITCKTSDATEGAVTAHAAKRDAGYRSAARVGTTCRILGASADAATVDTTKRGTRSGAASRAGVTFRMSCIKVTAGPMGAVCVVFQVQASRTFTFREDRRVTWCKGGVVRQRVKSRLRVVAEG